MDMKSWPREYNWDHLYRIPLTDREAMDRAVEVRIDRKSGPVFGPNSNIQSQLYYVHSVDANGVICRPLMARETEVMFIPWHDINWMWWQVGWKNDN